MNKQTKIIIGIIFFVLVIYYLNNLTPTQKEPTKSVEKMPTAYSPKELFDNKDPMVQVQSFTKPPIYSTVQQKEILFTFFDPTYGYCCDSGDIKVKECGNSCAGYCSYQCSGSFSYCDAWCNPKTEQTCASGYIQVPGTTKCCPSNYPNYCSANNLCYTEINCGQGTLGEVKCQSSPIAQEGNILFRKEIVTSVANINSCIPGTIQGCGLNYGGTTDQDCKCNLYAWDANGISSDLNNQFFFTSNPQCNSCSGNLCVRSNRCNVGEVKCASATQYYSCQNIKPNYFASSFNDYSRTLETCPSGTICNVNRCEKDTDGDGFPDSIDQCPNNAPDERVNKFGCPNICGPNEVKLTDGSCKQLVQTCIDNNLNNICDANDPIIWADPTNNVPICADRNGDRICDGVEGLFCKDSNNNKICDSDEVKWLATYCLDENGNGICDGIESTKVTCNKDIQPVCDTATNITYPNLCLAGGFNVVNTVPGSCIVSPIIIRKDCATGDVPTPAGYICDFETGWLIKREVVYKNITIDCRNSQPLEGYTCTNVGEQWVWTKTELINIDCYSRGCPKSNQLCQGGICVESSKRCPKDIVCSTAYGKDSVCDETIGLCVLKQYVTREVKINNTIIVKEQAPPQIITKTITKTVYQIPTWLWLVGAFGLLYFVFEVGPNRGFFRRKI